MHFATYNQTMMWKSVLLFCLLVYFSNGLQIFTASFSKIFPVGRSKANCTFDLSFSDDALIDHKLTCSGRTRRNSPEFEVTYSSKSMHIITLKLRFQSRKLTVLSSKVQKSIISLVDISILGSNLTENRLRELSLYRPETDIRQT